MSTLLVQNIKHTNGTTAATVNSSGVFASAGHILQTVDFTYSTLVDTESTGYVDTGVSAVITPKFSNSKIYVTGFLHCRIYGEHDHGVSFKLRRTVGGTTTDVYTAPLTYEYYFYDGTANTTIHDSITRFPMFVVDTPSSTSACTYAYQYASMRTSDSNNTQMQPGSGNSHGFLSLIHI